MVIVFYLILSFFTYSTLNAQDFENHLKYQYNMNFQKYPKYYERCPRYNTKPPYLNYTNLETNLLTDSFFINNPIEFVPENDIFNAALFQDTSSLLLIPQKLSEFFFRYLHYFSSPDNKDYYNIYYVGEYNYSENYTTKVFVSICIYFQEYQDIEIFLINHKCERILSSISLSEFMMDLPNTTWPIGNFLNSARIFEDGVIVWFDSAEHSLGSYLFVNVSLYKAINFLMFRRNRAYRFGPCAHLRIHETKGTIETVRFWRCCK